MFRLPVSVLLSKCQNNFLLRHCTKGANFGKFSQISTSAVLLFSFAFGKESKIMAKPKLIVFDLDYTLWPFWVDTHVDPPFKMASSGKVYDAHEQHVKFYRDVPAILEKLHKEGYLLGIASRTGAASEASDLLRLFNWNQYFHYRQIYPGCKITHFKRLRGESGLDYEEMIFFDDESRNIVDVSSLGVTCILCRDGVTNDVLKEGLDRFASTHA